MQWTEAHRAPRWTEPQMSLDNDAPTSAKETLAPGPLRDRMVAPSQTPTHSENRMATPQDQQPRCFTAKTDHSLSNMTEASEQPLETQGSD